MRIVCPGCKKVLEDVPADYPPRPFCSARCKLVDLNGWLSEHYYISQPLSSTQISPLQSSLQGEEDDEGCN